MEENPLFTKKRKTMEENQNPSDMAVPQWTSLPDDMLDDILDRLGFFPTKSITISATTFDINLGHDLYQIRPHLLYILDNLFTIFANLPLLNTFRLQLPHAVCLKRFSWHIIGSWVRRLHEHNLQHFELTTHYNGSPYGGYRVEIPNVFRMNSLISLDLNLCMDGFIWSIPNSIDFPNLEKLSLILVDYTNLGILIRSCPSLRDLSLKIHKHQDPGNKDSISISSKQLKRLNVDLRGPSILEVLIDAPKLEDLNFSSNCVSCDEIMSDSISHIKSLTLVKPSPLLDNYPTTVTKTTIFPNMTRLKLGFGPFKRIEELSSILHCPNLEELVLEVDQFYWTGITQTREVSLFENLKRLELQMNTIRLDQDLLELAAYILRSAPVLEKLILYASWSYSTKSPLDDPFYRSLFECPRSSPHCQIELSGVYMGLRKRTKFERIGLRNSGS